MSEVSQDKPEEFDRSKLKCFRELNMYSRNQPGNYRRPRGPCFPQGLIMKRIEVRDPFQLSDDIEIPIPFYTASIYRHKSTNLKGKRTIFQLKLDESIQYTAKMKLSSDGESIPICKGDQCHMSSQEFFAFLIFSNNFMDFSLRKESKFNDESLSLTFRHDLQDIESPRTVNVFFFDKKEGKPSHLINEPPTYVQDQDSWEVDLNSNTPLESIKNAKLVDENKKPMMFVRKMEKDRMEVEAQFCFDPIECFAIGIASFLCKI